MSTLTLPAPGGAVTPTRFMAMAFGAAGGIYLYSNHVSAMMPDSWEKWAVGPISGTTFWFGVFALLGGAAASMALSKIHKG